MSHQSSSHGSAKQEEAPHSPVFQASPEPVDDVPKVSESAATSTPPSEPRARRAARPKSFADESRNDDESTPKAKRGRKKKTEDEPLSATELAVIEAQFASMTDAAPSSNGHGTRDLAVIEDDLDDGNASPELLLDDSDEDAEEVTREKQRRSKKKSTPKVPSKPAAKAAAKAAVKSPFTLAASVASSSSSTDGPTTRRGKRAAEDAQFDVAAIRALAAANPDSYFLNSAADAQIKQLNRDHPLALRPAAISHPGQLYSMNLTPDGELMCTATALGSVRIWDTTEWSLLNELRDESETHIEEFYSAQFTPDGKKVIAAGKLKQREKWSDEDEDNEITPSPIKIFDAVTGEVISRLDGHLEEILCVRVMQYRGEHYLLSCGQDGRIFKWRMAADYSGLKKGVTVGQMFDDEQSSMVFSLAIVPQCGSRYFLGACDDGLKLYDFETGQVLQSFPALYTCFCDCVKFVQGDELGAEPDSFYLVTRGVENLRDDDSSKTVRPNRCLLHRLRFPTSPTGEWTLETVQTYQHTNYFSNMWPMKISANGRYVAVGSTYGEVFIWNLRSGELVGMLADHEECEVRDILFHPTKPWLLTCAGDSTVKVYAAT